ncbi:hypothetical protein CYMTET_36500, partial [Cymbomonas tetramitiformis]
GVRFLNDIPHPNFMQSIGICHCFPDFMPNLQQRSHRLWEILDDLYFRLHTPMIPAKERFDPPCLHPDRAKDDLTMTDLVDDEVENVTPMERPSGPRFVRSTMVKSVRNPGQMPMPCGSREDVLFEYILDYTVFCSKVYRGPCLPKAPLPLIPASCRCCPPRLPPCPAGRALSPPRPHPCPAGEGAQCQRGHLRAQPGRALSASAAVAGAAAQMKALLAQEKKRSPMLMFRVKEVLFEHQLLSKEGCQQWCRNAHKMIKSLDRQAIKQELAQDGGLEHPCTPRSSDRNSKEAEARSLKNKRLWNIAAKAHVPQSTGSAVYTLTSKTFVKACDIIPSDRVDVTQPSEESGRRAKEHPSVLPEGFPKLPILVRLTVTRLRGDTGGQVMMQSQRAGSVGSVSGLGLDERLKVGPELCWDWRATDKEGAHSV